MVNEEQVREQLKTVKDPELFINIVDLGLVYEVGIRNQELGKTKVFILLTLTSPGCPLADTFEGMITKAVKKLEEVNEVNVELTFDPPWNQDMMSEEAKAELGFF
jgi:metal-sulfur cluster biosynthetic enzyme